MKIAITFLTLFVFLTISLTLTRNYDELLSFRVWKKLIHVDAPATSDVFTLDLVADLPSPARRYFEHMIKQDTPMKRVSYIEMGGRLGLGPKNAPDYMALSATQISAFPDGFVWKVKSGQGPMVLTGFDGLYRDKSWSRFWLMHSIPAGRAGGRSKHREDHRRAAFGRLVAEVAFWSPAALLPNDKVRWEALDKNIARATIEHNGLIQTVDIYIRDSGQPEKVIIPRWSDANSDNIYQIQPFGGYLSDFKDFDGYRLPTHVEGGNFIGTDAFYPFFIADIKDIKFFD